MKDVFIISETHVLDETAIKYTVDLKRKLIAEFNESMSFFPSGKYVIVHSSDANPCQYGVAFLQGSDLRYDDSLKWFGGIIKRKVCERNEEAIEWPLSREQLAQLLDKGALPELYNAMYHTLFDGSKKNEFGYNVTTSSNKATRICSIACDWEYLIANKPLPKQTVTGLVLHRISGMCSFELNIL